MVGGCDAGVVNNIVIGIVVVGGRRGCHKLICCGTMEE